jgi:hypothetical protein
VEGQEEELQLEPITQLLVQEQPIKVLLEVAVQTLMPRLVVVAQQQSEVAQVLQVEQVLEAAAKGGISPAASEPGPPDSAAGVSVALQPLQLPLAVVIGGNI